MSVRYHTVSVSDIRIPELAPLLDEAIRRAVARVIETGELLNVEAEARRMAASYPGICLTRIADLLLRAGVEARINLALGPRSLAGGCWAPSSYHDSSSGEPVLAAAPA